MVRVPTPSPHIPSDADWRALIFALKGVEGRSSWLIREIIEVRNVCCSILCCGVLYRGGLDWIVLDWIGLDWIVLYCIVLYCF